MSKQIRKITDSALLKLFEEALAQGAVSLADASRIARAKLGLTQAAFAARAGVALKVIKQLEGGQGNPRLQSIERIAAAAGMRLGLVPHGATVRLGAIDRYVRRQTAARRAGLRAVRQGKTSLKRQHARNALRGSDFVIELPPLT